MSSQPHFASGSLPSPLAAPPLVVPCPPFGTLEHSGPPLAVPTACSTAPAVRPAARHPTAACYRPVNSTSTAPHPTRPACKTCCLVPTARCRLPTARSTAPCCAPSDRRPRPAAPLTRPPLSDRKTRRRLPTAHRPPPEDDAALAQDALLLAAAPVLAEFLGVVQYLPRACPVHRAGRHARARQPGPVGVCRAEPGCVPGLYGRSVRRGAGMEDFQFMCTMAFGKKPLTALARPPAPQALRAHLPFPPIFALRQLSQRTWTHRTSPRILPASPLLLASNIIGLGLCAATDTPTSCAADKCCRSGVFIAAPQLFMHVCTHLLPPSPSIVICCLPNLLTWIPCIQISTPCSNPSALSLPCLKPSSDTPALCIVDTNSNSLRGQPPARLLRTRRRPRPHDAPQLRRLLEPARAAYARPPAAQGRTPRTARVYVRPESRQRAPPAADVPEHLLGLSSRARSGPPTRWQHGFSIKWSNPVTDIPHKYGTILPRVICSN
ncbi:hypothetical protein GGX14DRAFT_574212 [Mycena pura]|uniref:Uncharacterized protein n=1 Tax=Mycena pura TaxID=153505 RepID=A0AAD6V1Q3_9AGAR|nr:hypothetical protein GGX14DRAFT_574212 [Mycena pura]